MAPASSSFSRRTGHSNAPRLSCLCYCPRPLVAKHSRLMTVLSDRFSAIAAASRTWVDKFRRGIVIVLCVVLAIFLGGQLIEASVFVLGQIPRFADVKCDIINGV